MDQKVNIKKLITISGVNNSGKTIFAANLYKRLYDEIKPECHQVAFWPCYQFIEVAGANYDIDKIFSDYIKHKKGICLNESRNISKVENTEYVDFIAIMKYNEYSIVIISEGDDKKDLEDKINLLCSNKNQIKYNDGKNVVFDRTNLILSLCIQDTTKSMCRKITWLEKFGITRPDNRCLDVVINKEDTKDTRTKFIEEIKEFIIKSPKNNF